MVPQKTNSHATVQLALTVSFFTELSKKGLLRRHFHLLWIYFSKSECFGSNSYFCHMFRTKIDLFTLIITNSLMLMLFVLQLITSFCVYE